MTDSYPLTASQEGMLFCSICEPSSGVFVQQRVCRFCEALDVAALRKAFAQVIKRHPILRTSFHWEGQDQPVQRVHPSVELPFAEEDWQLLGSEAAALKLNTYLAAERKQGFDLRQAPAMRVAVFHMGSQDYQMVFSHHHILLDGRSAFILLKELFAYYEAVASGQDIELPEPPAFADYVRWAQAQDHSKAETYWRERLKGFSAPTPLISLPPVPPTEKALDRHEFKFSAHTTETLKRLAKEHKVTENSVLQGAWALLLARYSGEEDVVFGIVRAGRHGTIPGIDSMVGLFINTLPLRVAIQWGVTVLDYLAAIRTQNVALRDFDHTPLSRIQGWSAVPATQPLFESIFVYENYLLNSTLRAQGGKWLNREFSLIQQTNLPLAVSAWWDQELAVRFEYDRSRFDASTIQRMAGHLQVLTEAMLADPSAPVGTLSMITAEERQVVLQEWNATQVEFPREVCVHQLIEAQVRRSPDAVALVCEENQLTYSELDGRANALAGHLRSLGVGPDVLVGICLERSVEMVVAVLAVLKAGGAYVPLDPAYPKDRLAYVIEDARMPVLLTEARLLPELPKTGAINVCVDRDLTEQGPNSSAPTLAPTGPPKPSNLAYVLYTSGSTGKPKGVQIEHRSLVNFLCSMRQTPGICSSDVLLAVTTLSFDIAGLELHLPLTVGAKIVLAKRETAMDGRLLTQTMARHGVTFLQATPTTWHLLLEAGWTGIPALKILCGGEALSSELGKALLTRCGSLWNMYGPTETTIWSSACLVEPGRPITISPPIANTQFYLLDPHGHPVPIGVPGELYIGGDGLARGYLNRPDLTTEKFVPDPFSNRPDARLYRTGDLARFRPDGTIHFLGRADHQVKIRGFRIELGEIESLLAQHPLVKETVVVARAEPQAEKRLVAYVVFQGAEKLEPAEFRKYLQEKLPEYTVPSAFVSLERLPLTPNGKVDRKALPAPAEVPVEEAGRYLPPRDALEMKLARIWQKILGRERISVEANFFDLGGHSLLAVRLMAQVEKLTGKSLPLATLLQAPTIQRLAAVIRDANWKAPWHALVPIQPGGSRPPLFCLHAVGGNILSYYDMASHMGADQPIYGLQSLGLDTSRTVQTRIEEMATAYIEEVRSFYPEGPYCLAGFCFGGIVAYEMAQQLHAQGQAVALLALLDTVPNHVEIRTPTAALPTAERKPQTENFLLRRLKFQLSQIARLSPGGWVAYGRSKLKTLKGRFRHKLWQATFAACQKVGFGLPRFLQDVEESNYLAARNYRFKPYPGRIVYIRPGDRTITAADPEAVWRQLAKGGLEVFETSGNHANMDRDPHAEVLAAHLKTCLRNVEL